MEDAALSQEIPANHTTEDNTSDTIARGTHAADGYPYQPLPTASSIRLLEFEPVEHGRPRVIRMHVVDLLDNPKYAALSYTWGDQDEPALCRCDGHHVRITANLAAFFKRFDGDGLTPRMWFENSKLRSKSKIKSSGGYKYDHWTENLFITKILPSVAHNLRLWPSIPASPRLLWVDSLCINQRDSAEVSQQVSLMGEIYRRAELVNVWLGDEKDAIETLPTMRAFAEVMRYWHMTHRDPCRQETPIGPSDWSLTWETNNPSISKLLSKTDGQAERDGQRPRIAAQYNIYTFGPLFDSPWFRRAWTYQESQLASRKIFTLGRYNLPDTHMQAALCLLGEHYAGMFNVFKGAEAMISTPSNMINTERRVPCCHKVDPRSPESAQPSLLELLLTRRGAQSALPSDLIYSLLGLASDGSEAKPDYDLSWQEVFTRSIAPWLSSQVGLTKLFAESNNQDNVDGLPSWVPDWRRHRDLKSELPITRHTPCPGSYRPDVVLSPCNRLLNLQGRIIDVVSGICYPEDFSIIIRSDATYSQTGEFPLTAIDEEQRDAKFFDTRHGHLGKGVSHMQLDDEIAVIYGLCRPLILRRTPSGSYRFVGQCYLCLGKRGDEGKHIPETQGWLDVPNGLRNTITLE